MEMHQIRYFLAVSETLNFTQAAKQCNVTQPALTRAIQQLEHELGGELLRRERSLTHLTELGMRMRPLMQKCYETALAAKSLAHSVKEGAASPLAIAISHTVNLDILMPSLRKLSAAFTGLQLKLRRGSGPEVSELLKSGEVEFAIAGLTLETWDRFDMYPLFDEAFELFVTANHKLANKSRVNFDDMINEHLLLHAHCEMADALANCLSARGVKYQTSHQAASIADLTALLEADMGIAILPASGAASKNLRQIPIAGLDVQRTVAVYAVAGRRRSDVNTTLLNLLRAAQWPQSGPNHRKAG
jgi:DNA-binding transcriptional LysR family regulator